MAALLGGGPAEVPERYAAADPCGGRRSRCRLSCSTATRDDQVPSTLSRRYAGAGCARQVAESTLVELPEAEHFGLIDPQSAAWQFGDELRCDPCT